MFYGNGGLRRHNGRGFFLQQLGFSLNISKPAALALRACI